MDDLPCIVLVDTEKNTGRAPVKTLFHLPNYYWYPFLFLERGMHKPSPAECLAPFYQDCTQRIAALSKPNRGYLVFPVESLLRVAEDRGGCKIGWDEWKAHVVATTSHPGLCVVSGCRLFCITSAGPNLDMEMHDFSRQGRAKYLSEQVNTDMGGHHQIVENPAIEYNFMPHW